MDAILSDLELRWLASQLYPNLPYPEAVLEINHDIFVKFPKEIAKASQPIMTNFKENPADVFEIAATCTGDWRIQLLALFTRIASKSYAKDPKPTINGSTTGGNNVPYRLNPGLLQSLPSAMAGQSLTGNIDNVIREIHGVHVIGKSLVDHINYYGRWLQTVSAIQIAQGHQAIQALNVICDHLRDTNTITVSGGSGPDGFARPVYDFIQKKIHDINQLERHKHRFFVYHPDTNWYGAFHRLIRESPLPPEFCAKADNLDTICLFMQDVRQRLAEASDGGESVVFHLLIPSWYSIFIREPLHFPDSLQPLRVEGEKHKGKELVEMNLPAAPREMLSGIANVLDPRSSNAIASVTSMAVTGPVVGWGINGACLALGIGVGAITGLGPLLAVPVWFGTAAPAMETAGPVIQETIYNTLCEEAPRILGSTERMVIQE